jgi:hypothetical protein
MTDLILRFLLGGVIVSAFSVIAEVLRPKRFAGLFGAAPSVALATLPLTIHTNGALYAATEVRSMIAGAVAFLIYAWCVSRILIRGKHTTLLTTTALLPLWIAAAAGLYWIFLRGLA